MMLCCASTRLYYIISYLPKYYGGSVIFFPLVMLWFCYDYALPDDDRTTRHLLSRFGDAVSHKHSHTPILGSDTSYRDL